MIKFFLKFLFLFLFLEGCIGDHSLVAVSSFGWCRLGMYRSGMVGTCVGWVRGFFGRVCTGLGFCCFCFLFFSGRGLGSWVGILYFILKFNFYYCFSGGGGVLLMVPHLSMNDAGDGRFWR